MALAMKLQDDVKNAFSGDLEGCVSLSIGIAICPRQGTGFDELYKAADSALYYVKAHGKAGAHMQD